QRESRPRDLLAVAQDLSHGRVTAFLHGTERFLFQRRDATRDVAGRRILVHRLIVLQEVALEVVHDLRNAGEHLLVRRALHEQPFCAEDFRDLRQDRRAACVRDAIGDAPYQWIRRDAAEPVRAAALQSHGERSKRTRLALDARSDVCEFFDDPQPFFDFILRRLRGERADVRALRLGNLLQQRLELVRLAAESEDQHAAGIGMPRECGDELARALEIAAELRATELMWERIHAVNAIFAAVRRLPRDALRSAADAADRAKNPDLVARADATVGAPVAHERQGLCGRGGRALDSRYESIFIDPRKQRREIVGVDVRTACNRRRGAPDDLAVLTYRLARSHRP